jgi:uncharacterized membrane protein YphA (DoxX/SURF4 family)
MTQSLGKFLGRLCLSAVFLVSAFMDIQNWLPMTMLLTHKGFPASPLFLSAAVFLKLVGGVSILTGIKGRWGAGRRPAGPIHAIPEKHRHPGRALNRVGRFQPP